MKRKDQKCGNCYYFVQVKPKIPKGECRRNSPRGEKAGWPRTYSVDWCGEWKETQE